MEIKYGRKRSGIIRELKRKIQEWLDSISDPIVRKAAEQDVIVTGGSIYSMLMGDKINDFDLYFRTKATTKLIAEYYVAKFNEKNKLKISKGVIDYKPIVREENLLNVKGIAEDKANKQTALISSALGIAKPIVAYANATNNPQLR